MMLLRACTAHPVDSHPGDVSRIVLTNSLSGRTSHRRFALGNRALWRFSATYRVYWNPGLGREPGGRWDTGGPLAGGRGAEDPLDSLASRR
jgi:hypothetical protein